MDRVIKQALVRLRLRSGLLLEQHVQIGFLEVFDPGSLCHEAHARPGGRVDPDDHLVSRRLVGLHSDPGVRRPLEDDPDLGVLDRKVLAGAQVEGNAGPAPVVDRQFHRGVGLDLRVVGHVRNVPVALVLPPDALGGIGRADRLEQLELLGADRVVLVRVRRFHRQQPQHLQHVILDDVTDRADAFVETSPVLDPEVLAHRHLDVGHVIAVPDRLQQGVGEPEVGDVHHRFLAQVVVDPQDLVLAEDTGQVLLEFLGRLRVVPEGLLEDHPRIGGQAGTGKPVNHLREERWRDLEVEERPAVVGEFLAQ